MKLLKLIFALLLFGCTSNSNPSIVDNQLNTTSSDTIIPNTNCTYHWDVDYENKNAIVNRIATPKGYKRVAVQKGSFEEWLRFLPLKPANTPVKLYNNKLKWNQSAHFAVMDIDVGNRDLQQCADAVMRLKAEYHYSKNRL